VENLKQKRRSVLGAVISLAFLLAVVWVVVRWDAPPLRVSQQTSGVKVDVSTLREYPTTITHIRLSELGANNILWELKAQGGVVQLHGFSLVEGENPVHIDTDYGRYSLLEPYQSAKFILRKRTEYKLELWGSNSTFSKKTVVFHIAD
jgi:hypothetical protein